VPAVSGAFPHFSTHAPARASRGAVIRRHEVMHLLLIYLVIITVGEVIAFGLGRIVEDIYPAFSMVLYMAMFFGVLWGGWPIAVDLTGRWDRAAGKAVAPRKP
jgi:hypothetical protein